VFREQASLPAQSASTAADTSSQISLSSDQWTNLAEAIEKGRIKIHVDMPLSIESHGGDLIRILPWTKSGVGAALISIFLEHLHFPEMSDRQERIPKAHAQTFEWIFSAPQKVDKPWDNFTDWFESSSDLYWITGKPGSGKSTLMKFIFNDLRTREYLIKWSEDIPLVVATFYFWNSGTTMQMNQSGLLQSLLHQALSQRWSLTSRSIPEELYNLCLSKNFSQPWVWTELVQSLRILIEEEPSLRYFFLIDGMDEFSGDKSELIELITTFASYPNIKICVSSRPWVVFEDAYKQKPSLTMENLTYADIMLYISAKFDTSPAFAEMKQVNQTYCNKLVEDVATKASGVFLWVVLTVKSLLEGLANGDRPQDIQERLDLIPPDLEGLFRRILDNLDPRYIKHSSQLFQIFSAAKKPPTVLCMALADEGVEQALAAEIKPLTTAEIRYKAMTMRRRLNSRCKGLLEVGSLEYLDADPQSQNKLTEENHCFADEDDSSAEEDGSPAEENEQSIEDDLFAKEDDLTPVQVDILADAKVQYLHRTVKDFLERPEIWCKIVAAIAPPFHPLIALYASHLLQLKSLDPQSMSRAHLWNTLTWAIEYAASAELHLTHSDYVTYLDEIDRVASKLCERPLMSGSTFTYRHAPKVNNDKVKLCVHWTSTVPSRKRKHNTTFLSVAVWCGLSSYIATKVRRGANASRKERWPLLISAVMDYDIFYLLGHTDRPHCAHPEPSSKIVELLLQNGANPNQITQLANRRSVSPWKEVLKHKASESEEWMKIHELFIAHGATTEEPAAAKPYTKTWGPKWADKFGFSGLKSFRRTKGSQSWDDHIDLS
jgi:hypothetical protein